ncbi:UDP-glucuronic acid decarboxylase 6 [Fulvia fulva]|nr:UDP-glucuronic acid decarboxylase 6 [Fulvia fulva]KAK4632592.1 UDP-glucuronic acid decarboxylase 6 [Fulvia fulva]WPV11994.1 UDP-glucuronic acid decarboxylase 6 [Fulvia fulva]WPV26270.1 UDP-glucuronic acid decarboxylase 6 [Fulvia fulva]
MVAIGSLEESGFRNCTRSSGIITSYQSCPDIVSSLGHPRTSEFARLRHAVRTPDWTKPVYLVKHRVLFRAELTAQGTDQPCCSPDPSMGPPNTPHENRFNATKLSLQCPVAGRAISGPAYPHHAYCKLSVEAQLTHVSHPCLLLRSTVSAHIFVLSSRMSVLNGAAETRQERILVTGGAGFIGSRLVSALLERGKGVIVLDNYWTSFPATLSSVRDNPNFRFVQGDVTSPIPNEIEACQQIYHLACPASPKHFNTEPIRILDTCYLGTRNVLNKAREWKARVLLASTSEVYGQSERDPQDETYFGNVNCFGERSCYDEGKRVAEALAYAYRVEHGSSLEIRVARIFNAYGPGMHASDGRVVCSFIGAAIEGRELLITGDGAATRCFQYVDDCVSGLMSLMRSSWEGGPVNIGSEKETTIVDLALLVVKAVSAATGRPQATFKYSDALPDDPVQRRPDCALAREVLGWVPTIELADGVRQTIEWHLGLEVRTGEAPLQCKSTLPDTKDSMFDAVEARRTILGRIDRSTRRRTGAVKRIERHDLCWAQTADEV